MPVYNISKAIDTAVEDWAKQKLGDNYSKLMRLINAANYDLYFGPYNEGDEIDNEWTYPGFVSALSEIEDMISDLPDTVYFETWSECIIESEPEGYEDEDTGEWIEPDFSEYYQVSVRESLCGKELNSYF